MKKAGENTTEQFPAWAVREEEELPGSGTLTHYVSDFDSSAIISMENNELLVDFDGYSISPEALFEPPHPGADVLPQLGKPSLFDDGVPPADECFSSSEGDYFYTDGKGNVFPIDRHVAQDTDETEWPATPQLINSEGISYEADEVEGEQWDANAHATYIMYHEVQHWPPVPGARIDAEDVAGQPWMLLHLDDAPFASWADDGPEPSSKSSSRRGSQSSEAPEPPDPRARSSQVSQIIPQG
jgi:hypothetical protein